MAVVLVMRYVRVAVDKLAKMYFGLFLPVIIKQCHQLLGCLWPEMLHSLCGEWRRARLYMFQISLDVMPLIVDHLTVPPIAWLPDPCGPFCLYYQGI